MGAGCNSGKDIGNSRIHLADLQKTMEPSRYVGRSREQVEAFLRKVISPILQDNSDLLGVKVEINV